MNQHTSIVPRATIDGLVAHRAHALELFVEARQAIERALDAAAAAAGGRRLHIDGELASKAFGSAARTDEFLDEIRRRTDQNAWRHIVMGHGFEKLMDRQAMKEFQDQLDLDPPEVTAEVAEATLRQLMSDADRLMRRGIANTFSKLDRRFRSHDGFKIGSRVVLDFAFGEYGSWNHHARHDDTLRDIERTLFALDGVELPERYAGIVGAVDEFRRQATSRFACTVETEYLRVRTFRNGNAHVWFLRDDLLEQLNRLLAEHYGETLGSGPDAVEPDPFANPKRSLARNMGWFPTPPDVVRRLLHRSDVAYCGPRDGSRKIRILEPSAGEGAIALAALADAGGSAKAEVTCVELEAGRAATLRAAGFVQEAGHRTIQADFLDCDPDRLGVFDAVLMNPPFDLERDIDHVVHATRFLAPGGRLVAIMSAGVEFRTSRKAEAFRALVARMSGDIHDLPPGSFESSGTMVNTCIVVLQAPRA